ncbi:hypothetical protein J1N35_006885 [Gossypium stocksii]|uniref:Uncharacterized protein n=1 Tax=Gossypium stocksii TaxID=47602 RepID=A0A9D3W6P5_9ROSI|nr:hypothetical protein J1N35_006885 [Gossypium stocksii]
MNPDVLPPEWWKPHVRSSLSSIKSCPRKYSTKTSEFLYFHELVSSSNTMVKYGGTIFSGQSKMPYGSFPTAWIHKVYLDDIRNSDINYREIQKFLCQLNKPVQYKPYHKEILKAIQEYYESIPDPSKWSQDYPWYCSQINLNKIRMQENKMEEEKSEEGDNYSESSMDNAQLPHSNTNS